MMAKAKEKKPSRKLPANTADPKQPPTAKEMEIANLINPVTGKVTLLEKDTGNLREFWPVDAAQLLEDTRDPNKKEAAVYLIPE